MVILELIHAPKLRPETAGTSAFISSAWRVAKLDALVTLDNYCRSHGLEPATRLSSVCSIILAMVCYRLTMVTTGNGGSGFDSGEGA